MKNMEYNEYKLNYTNEVEEELDEIYNYISQVLKEPEIARRQINKIRIPYI